MRTRLVPPERLALDCGDALSDHAASTVFVCITDVPMNTSARDGCCEGRNEGASGRNATPDATNLVTSRYYGK